jgi:hypothetical protein
MDDVPASLTPNVNLLDIIRQLGAVPAVSAVHLYLLDDELGIPVCWG